MKEITFSAMRNNAQTEMVLRQVLDDFEQQSRVHVHLQMLEWPTAHQEATRFALHMQGPDVSVMGTTWVADLISMNVLRPFTQTDLSRIGNIEEFVAPAWESTHLQGDEKTWAVPWLVDTYVIHYHRDLLERAGIDPQVAFSSLQSLDETVGRLRAAGWEIPIQLPYSYDRYCMMHTLAAWIWGSGGEFCSADGRQARFDEPEALRGLKDYFRLARHVSPSGRQRLSKPDCELLFHHRQAALAFGTFSFRHFEPGINPEVFENWHAAPLPGPHFVGGVNLVVWKYTPYESEALELIRFLNRPEVVSLCAQAMATSPARLSALDLVNHSHDPLYQAVVVSIQTGRAYRPVRLWGLMEEKFIAALISISTEALQSPELELEATIQQVMQTAARRLNVTLSA